jgi:Uma2 family endonuclease
MVQLLQKPISDQRIIQSDRTWQQFKLIQEGFATAPGVRLSYYNGTIEILMPGKDHEAFKSLIGQLLELFFLKKGIAYKATGSMTQEKEGEASTQADESYCIGADKPIPDLSIEVIFSSGSEAKLTKYRLLGVPEVWFWEDGVLGLYHLRPDGYERCDRSQLPGLEELDIQRLSQCILMGETSHLEAAQTWFGMI